MASPVGREALEKALRSRLADYGVDASNFFIDWELKTVVVLCVHITSKMKIFMSKGTLSLGSVVRDTLVTAHRIEVGGQRFGLLVVYCKACFDSGVRMLFGES